MQAWITTHNTLNKSSHCFIPVLYCVDNVAVVQMCGNTCTVKVVFYTGG